MSYKINLTTPIQTYDIVFGKRNLEYVLEINGRETKEVKGSKETILKSYKKFLSSVGFGSQYSDILSHYEALDLKKFSSVKVYKEGE